MIKQLCYSMARYSCVLPIIMLSACVSVGSIYEDYQPALDSNKKELIDRIEIRDLRRTSKVEMGHPVFADDNKLWVGYGEHGPLAAFIANLADGVVENRARRKAKEFKDSFIEFDACIARQVKTGRDFLYPAISYGSFQPWTYKTIVIVDKDEVPQKTPSFLNDPSDILQLDPANTYKGFETWRSEDVDLIGKDDAKSGVINLMDEKSDGLELSVFVQRTIDFSYDFSVMSIAYHVSFSINEEPNIGSYTLFFQEYVDDVEVVKDADDLLCGSKKIISEVLPQDHLDNFLFWFTRSGEKFKHTINKSSTHHEHALNIIVSESSDKWDTPIYEKAKFLHFGSMPDSIKMYRSSVSLRANIVDRKNGYTFLRKYNGDYYIYKADKRPYSEYSF